MRYNIPRIKLSYFTEQVSVFVIVVPLPLVLTRRSDAEVRARIEDLRQRYPHLDVVQDDAQPPPPADSTVPIFVAASAGTTTTTLAYKRKLAAWEKDVPKEGFCKPYVQRGVHSTKPDPWCVPVHQTGQGTFLSSLLGCPTEYHLNYLQEYLTVNGQFLLRPVSNNVPS